MLLCRSVDNFLAYLSDLLLEILRKNPAVSFPFAKVRITNDQDELVTESIMRKVDSIAEKGFGKMVNYLSGRTDGLDLKLSLNHRLHQLAREAIATRNIVVHNRGRINGRFIRDVTKYGLTTPKNGLPQAQLKIGERFPIDFDHIEKWSIALLAIALQIDKAAITRWPLA